MPPTQPTTMKGIWAWPPESDAQDNALRKVMDEDELAKILFALEKSPEGLSNAQIDKLLGNNSQWRTLNHLRELIGLGFVQYKVQFFGNAGEYTLTDLGKTVVSRIRGGPPKHHIPLPNRTNYSLRDRLRFDWS
jgi:hypothetical protein